MYAVFYFCFCAFYLSDRLSRNSFKIDKVYFPFVLGWLWAVLVLILNAPPFDRPLIVVSRLALYLLFSLWIYQKVDYRLGKEFSIIVLGLAISESIVVLISGRPFGYLIGNPTYSALLIGSGIIFCLAKLDEKAVVKRKAVIYWGLFLLLTGALIKTHSRSVMVGTLIASLLFLTRPKARVLVGIAACSLIFFFTFITSSFLSFLKLNFSDFPNVLGRFIIWKTALLAIRDHWLFGFGPGGFEAAYRLYQQPSGHLLQFSHTTAFAHNDYLQLAVEGGFPGLVLFLWGSWRLARIVYRSWPLKGIQLWSAGVVVIFAVSGFFNFNVFLPLNGLLLAGCVALLAGSQPKQGSGKLGFRFGSLLSSTVLVVLTIFVVLYGVSDIFRLNKRYQAASTLMPVRGDVWYERALELLLVPNAENPLNSPQLLNYLRRAIYWDPSNPFAWSRLARVNAVLQPKDLEGVHDAFEKATSLAPHHAPFWMEWGYQSLSVGDLPLAKENFKRALCLEPRSPLPWAGVALVHLHQDEAEKSSLFFKKALSLKQKYGSLVDNSPYSQFLFGLDEARVRERIDRLSR